MNPTEDFRAALSNAGLKFGGVILDDGKLHRFDCDNEAGSASWYVLYRSDKFSAGAFGCWRRGLNEKWNSVNGQPLSPEERREMSRKIAAAEQDRKTEEEKIRSDAKSRAQRILSVAVPATSHSYLDRKKVKAHGEIRIVTESDSPVKDCLVLPIRDIDGNLHTLEFIAPDKRFGKDGDKRDKQLLFGGDPKAHFYTVSEKSDGVLAVCEGYATGASSAEATDWSVVCARNATNLPAVAVALRRKYPQRTIVILADDDERLLSSDDPNRKRGMYWANEAARLAKCLVVSPVFSDEDQTSTDFNDMALLSGLPSVKKQLESALDGSLGKRITVADLISFVPTEDGDSVLGNRYLCRGGSCVIIGQTSAGKSSFGMQAAIFFALGLPFFGIKVPRPLKSIIVQAENDLGDTAEMFQGILLGSGLAHPDKPEELKSVLKRLEQNLIIVRDQTHAGKGFSAFAKKLIDIHHPDLFWIDPFLSFYGDDINNQQSMTSFLRGELNPLSESSGIIWMLLHHTGKPSKDAAKSQKNWVSRDFAYMGIGSSELSNWARAIITISSSSDDEFRVVLAKRGTRAGVTDEKGSPVTELFLAHSTDHIFWKRIPKPEAVSEMAGKFASFSQTITTPHKVSDIIRKASAYLQRGSRTCWKFWDGGSGDLGCLFERSGDGWVGKVNQSTIPYKD